VKRGVALEGDARRQRLKALFAEAHALPEERRSPWLRDACADETALRAELESLLRAASEAGDFLESPALSSDGAAEAVRAATAPLSARDWTGRRIGPYRIVRELGRGGMGVVYLGARDDLAFEKLVAVKLLQSSLPTPALLQRFYEERRILAALDHVHIARLLDAGATDDGAPYVVMEYVEGQAIDQYCRAHGLATRRRLELFRLVCDAVQYSHQRLVVHRDIKAGNILVTADGMPKLLDFGIAKMLEPDEDGLATTRTALRALTPESASPEQVRGDPVTVASDVYSLGALLYRLLTEQSPYPSRPRTESEIVHAICEETPRRPSEVAARLRRELQGDLDLIVLKALRKEPERRYASVEQLAQDLERHLGGLPVRAAPDAWRYRAGKFLRRRRLAVSVAAVAALSVLAGAGISLEEARIARRERAAAQRRFAMVQRLAHAVVFDFNDALEAVPGATSARKLVVARAIEYLDSLSREEANDRPLLRELAAAYLRIGDIQGDPTRPNLGDAEGALDSYGHALALYERLAAVDASPETRAGLAAAHRVLATQYWARGEGETARSHLLEALRLDEGLLGKNPGDLAARLQVANIHYQLGQVELRQGHSQAATDDYTRAAGEYGALLAADPADRVSERGLALSYLKLGDAAGGGALAWYRKAASTLAVLAKRPGAPGDVPRISALAAVRLAEGLVTTSPTEAETQVRRAIAWIQPVADADPSNVQTGNDLGYALSVLGEVLRQQNRLDEAELALDRAVAILSRLLATNPGYMDGRRVLAIARFHQGGIALTRHRARAALAYYEQAVPVLEAKEVRSGAMGVLTDLYEGLGDAQAAVAAQAGGPARRAASRAASDWYRKSVAAWRELAAAQPLEADEAASYAAVQRKAGRARPR
jgi:tetratricopeptide (TPR) repeat protein